MKFALVIIFIIAGANFANAISSDILAVKQSNGKLKISEIVARFDSISDKLKNLIKNDKPKDCTLTVNTQKLKTLLPLNEKLDVKLTPVLNSALEAELDSMNLTDGKHVLTFEAAGQKKLQAFLYVYNETDKMIVSDIDGTVTKTDVRGQIFERLGIDWTHDGIVALFTDLAAKGYKFIYLSARPIAFKERTQNYIHQITQDGKKMPMGPIVTNPDEILSAFYLEVIKKAPQEFKIDCLKKIFSLYKPAAFKYGFGNKETDKITYRALGVEDNNIIIITKNSKFTFPPKFVGKTYRELIGLIGTPALGIKR